MILIAMLLLLDYENWVREWTITGDVSGYSLGSWFPKLFRSALTLAKNILNRMPRILRPIDCMIGSLEGF